MKRIAWVDTIRVAAALMVIFAHYFMCDGFEESLEYFHFALSYDVAIVGVFLFLAISGYLIPVSLKRAPNLWHFYSRKFIRIIVPFTVSYLALTAVLIPPALFSEKLFDFLPIFNPQRGGSILSTILGMIPFDLNVTKFFGLEVYWFIGEWFMGVILWMYLLSPLLNHFAERCPILTLASSIAISIAVFYIAKPFEAQGIIHDVWTLFIVRIPEFLFGMILFIHRDKLLKIRLPLVVGFSVFLAAYMIYFVATFNLQFGMYFAANPLSFALTLPAIYLLFTLAEVLNDLFPKILERLNSLNAATYIAMIIQHLIIYLFANTIDFEKLGTFGAFVMLLIVIATTFTAAQLIKKLSDSVEKIFTGKERFS